MACSELNKKVILTVKFLIFTIKSTFKSTYYCSLTTYSYLKPILCVRNNHISSVYLYNFRNDL